MRIDLLYFYTGWIQPPTMPSVVLWGAAMPKATVFLSGLDVGSSYVLQFASTIIGHFDNAQINLWKFSWEWSRDMTVLISNTTFHECFVDDCANPLPKSRIGKFSVNLIVRVYHAASDLPILNTSSHFTVFFGHDVSNGTVQAQDIPQNSTASDGVSGFGYCIVSDEAQGIQLHSIEPGLRLIVLTFNRSESLQRLVDSLLSAHYFGDTIALDIFVDKAAGQPIDPVTILTVSRFVWPHGPCRAILRSHHYGLRGQWLDSWKPQLDSREIGLILEDDTAVSPHFWKWLRAAHEAYGLRGDVAGFTLQRLQVYQKDGCTDPSVQESGGPADIFLNPILGSWGFSPTAAHWRRFTAWAHAFIASGEPPYVDGLKATGWYKYREERGSCPGSDCMWTMLHIRYTHTHSDRMTVHCRPRHGESLITNYREKGVNFDRFLGSMWPLVRTWDRQLEVFPKEIFSLDYSGSLCVGDCHVVEAAKKIFQRAGDWVILIVFNKSFLSITKSWLCNTAFIHGIWDKTLLISPELEAVNEIRTWNPDLNVVHWDVDGEFDGELEFGQLIYFRLMSRRLSLFLELLNQNVNIFIAESDAVWTGNPLHTLPHGSEWDIVAGWDQSVYMMGLSFVRANNASIGALSYVLGAFEHQLQAFHHGDEFKGDRDAIIFRNYVRSHLDELKVVALDSELHLGGKWYEDFSSIQYCKLPVTIQNNWIVGNSAKVDRMKNFGQWFLNSNEEQCAGNSPAEINQSVSKWLTCRKSPFLGLCGPGCIGTEYGGYFWTRPLETSSVVYSFGIGEDFSFEIGLAARYGVTVHMFDPTPRSFEHYSAVSEILNVGWTSKELKVSGNIESSVYEKMIRESSVKPEQLVFHAIGLIGAKRYDEMFCDEFDLSLEGGTPCADSIATFCAPEDPNWVSHTLCAENVCVCKGFQAPVKYLDLIMKELGHEHLTILKLDIEGVEMEVLSALDIQPDAIIVDNSEKLVESLFHDTQYKADNVQHERGTWINTGRNSNITSAFCKNPEVSPCPDGESFCRRDMNYMWAVGLKFHDHFLDIEKDAVFPVQSCADVTDVACLYMADPFLFHDSRDTWYLFTEVLNNDCQKGEIALSVSHDGLKSFQYLQIVLKELWHLSWPYVFEHELSHYMIACATAGSPHPPFLWLYESDMGDWPYRWKRKTRILFENPMVGYALDPVVFFHKPDNTWYLWTLDSAIGKERLFFSDKLNSGFMEHPDSPKHEYRHAGRIVVEEAGSHTGIWAFFQTGGTTPGTVTVQARKVDRLSRSEFQYGREVVQVAGPINNNAYTEQGMHTFGTHRLANGSWVSVVDAWFNDNNHKMWSCLKGGRGNNECWLQLTHELGVVDG